MNDQAAEAADRAYAMEDGPELREATRELAALAVDGFRIYPRHLAPLEDEAHWRGVSVREALTDLALAAAWTAVEADEDPATLVQRIRRSIDTTLDGEAPRATGERVALSPAIASPAPTADARLEADEVEALLLDGAGLSPAERQVALARIELGPSAKGAAIAIRAGVSEASERHLTRRLRKKISELVHKSPTSLPL